MVYSETMRERAEKLISGVIEPMGYELVEVTYTPGKKSVLTAYVYKKGGVTLDDLVAVNDALDAPLDAADITEGRSYTLNISSPGLDRPIVTDRDFARNEGVEVEAVMLTEGKKTKKEIGTLLAHDCDTVTIASGGATKVLARSEIKVLRPYIDLKKLK